MKVCPFKLAGGIVAATLLSYSSVHAVTLPDAGSIMQEQKPQRELHAMLPSNEEMPPEVSSLPIDRNVEIAVKGFRFEGYQGFANEAELQAVVSKRAGKTLNADELQDITNNVTAWLKKRGLLIVRAYFPEQELNSGIVTIAITASKSDHGIDIERDSRTRIRRCVLQCYANHGARAGQILKKDDLERSVLLINDLPGINVKALISPGSLPGTSAVKYMASEDSLITGVVWGDNYGNRYTGAWRGNVMVNVNDPLRYGDQLSVMFTGSSGLDQCQISYHAPVGSNGMKAKVSWSGMRYQLQDEFMPLDYGGVSSIVDGGLSYPVIRSRKTTVTTGVTVADKRLSDKRSGVNQDERHVSSGTISLDGVNFDELMGGGSMSWHTSMSSGDFHESNNFAHQDAVLNGSEGPFTYFSTSVDRLQRLSEKLSLNLSWSGQFANGNLSSGEKFYLGGPSGVRAYPVGEAGGDEGHLLNATVRYRLPMPISMGNVEVSGFYDAGRITLNHDRYTEDVVSATGRNTYWLQGAGIGLNWVYASTVVVHTTWAHTIGSNPGRSIYGMNADGRRDNSRFWLQAMLYF